MTIRRVDDTVLLEDVCAVEDAEQLIQELQDGAACIDWTGCTHLHTACLQVLIVAKLPMRGTPANPALARCLGPILALNAPPVPPITVAEHPSAIAIEA